MTEWIHPVSSRRLPCPPALLSVSPAFSPGPPAPGWQIMRWGSFLRDCCRAAHISVCTVIPPHMELLVAVMQAGTHTKGPRGLTAPWGRVIVTTLTVNMELTQDGSHLMPLHYISVFHIHIVFVTSMAMSLESPPKVQPDLSAWTRPGFQLEIS